MIRQEYRARTVQNKREQRVKSAKPSRVVRLSELGEQIELQAHKCVLNHTTMGRDLNYFITEVPVKRTQSPPQVSSEQQP